MSLKSSFVFAIPSLAALAGAAGSAHADALERGVLAEINLARTRPAAYAEMLRHRTLPVYGEADDGYPQPDADAANEAIAFLDHQRPLPPLRFHEGLARAAREHSTAQGPTGQFGHIGPSGDDLSTRLRRNGVWAGLSAEDISYGYATARGVVVQLIIDSRVPGRGHRQVIFDPALQAAGAGCAQHTAWGEMCVIDFAGALVER